MSRKKSSDKKIYHFNGVTFAVRYSRPSARRHSAMPCRAYIDPLDLLTGKRLTQRQVYGKDSDEPVHYTVYGKDERDIWDNQLEAAASHLITLMIQQGLLADGAEPDPAITANLADIARDFKDTFFELHRSEWNLSTTADYRRQYDVLADELVNLQVGDLSNEAYRNLQEAICRNALATSRKMESWKYGDEPPASARKRMSLLYELIQDLKQVEGVPLPAIPVRYNSKPSRRQQLLDFVDSARSLPAGLLSKALSGPSMPLQVGVLADAGLRISEVVGLCFESIQAVETSQGTMYCLVVDGQIQPSGKRTEITKTGSSYRVIPLSRELGELLMKLRQKPESQYGDLSLRLLCGHAEEGTFDDGPNTATAMNDKISKVVPALLRRPDFFAALKAKRAYCFEKKAQDVQLLSMATSHAMRRNFCTGLYCSSGLDTPEIYRQMGHADKSQPYRSAAGLTKEELIRMCLRKHVSSTLYHPANPLRYSVKGPYHGTEVPTCMLELVLEPGECMELTIEDTEPGTVTHMSGEGLSIQPVRRDEQRGFLYDYSFLAADAVTSGITKRKLFS